MGLLSNFTITDTRIEISGWIASKSDFLTHVTILLNSIPVAIDSPLGDYADINTILPDTSHAVQSVFHLQLPKTLNLDTNQVIQVQLVAKQNGREIGVVNLQIKDLSSDKQPFPIPPPEIQVRVGQLEALSFLQVGWRIFDSLTYHIQKYIELNTINRILDWGCGCGRVSRFMIESFGKERVFGCDIDGLSIDWTKSNLNSWTFTRVNGLPPTPYPDNYFDFIYGTSVFTHLTEPLQFKWLEELQRITRPGGIVAVSVMNQKDLTLIPQLKELLEIKGFADCRMIGSEYLVPFVDEEYYRVTFHTRSYISQHWSDYFELLEYIDQAINVNQDLVIMRKR